MKIKVSQSSLDAANQGAAAYYIKIWLKLTGSFFFVLFFPSSPSPVGIPLIYEFFSGLFGALLHLAYCTLCRTLKYQLLCKYFYSLHHRNKDCEVFFKSNKPLQDLPLATPPVPSVV